MTFDLLPGITPFVVAFLALAAVAAAVVIGAAGTFLVSNRRVRLTRRDSIPTYYRGLVLSH